MYMCVCYVHTVPREAEDGSGLSGSQISDDWEGLESMPGPLVEQLVF